MSHAQVKRGDRFVWTHPQAIRLPVYIQVTRVARDGQWADLACCNWAAAWRKRQPLPLPQWTERRAWTQADLDRDAEAALTAGGVR